MVKREDTIYVLQKAKDLIVEGWCQGELWNEKEYCVVGAIEAVSVIVGRGHRGYQAYQTRLAALNYLYDALPDSAKKKRFTELSATNEEHSLMDWNDQRKRKHSDVIDLYDKGLHLAKTASQED